jgi:hypothetical protein
MATRKQRSVRLVVSDEKSPKVALKEGLRLEVVKVSLVDDKLARIRRKPVARLCGGTDTCLALVATDDGDPV